MPHPAAPPGTFAPSELILTPRGTIYHLDLHPDALADTVITVGDPGRVPLVSARFDAVEHRAQHREFVTHTGRVGGRRITCVSTGIGPDNIDIVLTELDALANIDFASRTVKPARRALSIIRLGTAGALRPEVPLDSFVVSSFAIGLDNLMHYYVHEPNPDESYILNELVPHLRLSTQAIHPYLAEGSIRLRARFGSGFLHGMTATCPGFYGPQGRALRAPLAVPQLLSSLASFESRGHQPLNFEMETAAIYGLGKLLGHQCCSVSANVANRALGTFSADGNAAVERLIDAAFAAL